jgi:hypothetical protein
MIEKGKIINNEDRAAPVKVHQVIFIKVADIYLNALSYRATVFSFFS